MHTINLFTQRQKPMEICEVNLMNCDAFGKAPLLYFSSIDEYWKIHHEVNDGSRWEFGIKMKTVNTNNNVI